MIWDQRRLPTMFSAEDFAPPYDEAVKILQTPGAGKEDVAKVTAQKFLNNAKDAARNVNGLGEEKVYDDGLVKAAQAFRLGKKLEKAGNRLQQNETVDYMPLYGDLTSVVSGASTGLELASQIDYKHYKPFTKSGYAPIDDIVGGIPADGPIVVYGMTSVGKSHFAAHLSECFLKQHKDWTGAVYTLEMSAEHWLYREVNMYPEIEKFLDRLSVSGSVRGIDELTGQITAKRVNFVVIDDMDGMVADESASEYQKVYKRIREIARFLKIPVIVLAQPNRMAKLSGRFLRPYDIAWSGGGENSAALLIALQQASSLDMEDDLFPVFDVNKFYMIFWKSRDGWPVQRGPGAIILDENKSQLWKGAPYKNTLWAANSGKQTIGKKRSK